MKKISFINILTILIILILTGCKTTHLYNNSAEIETDSRINEELKLQIKNIINQNITDDMSEYDIAKKIHDYIIITTDFDSDNLSADTVPDDSYSAYGALINHISVCQGYAEAYKLLTTEAGLECKIISGTANGISHAWNIIRIDGEWYNVDVTWDDPTGNDKTGSDNLTYNYFLIPDSVMYKEHTPDGKVPECTSDKYLYGPKTYNAINLTIDSQYSIPNHYMNAYLQGNSTVTFYFKVPAAEIDESVLNQTAQKLQSMNINVTNAVYTPVIKLGDYYCTTISFS